MSYPTEEAPTEWVSRARVCRLVVAATSSVVKKGLPLPVHPLFHGLEVVPVLEPSSCRGRRRRGRLWRRPSSVVSVVMLSMAGHVAGGASCFSSPYLVHYEEVVTFTAVVGWTLRSLWKVRECFYNVYCSQACCNTQQHLTYCKWPIGFPHGGPAR